MSGNAERFLRRQEHFFTDADVSHYFWQVQNPVIARTERELLDGFPIGPGGRMLEVGCGEGANLFHLLSGDGARPRVLVGVDLYERKLAFARQQKGVGGVGFVCGDARFLPFADQAFDSVLCRDVLHHMADPQSAVRELGRVCKPDGAIWIIEPNGANPLMRLLAALRPHERGLLRNSLESLTALTARDLHAVRLELRQPMPVYRLTLHHRFGFATLGRLRVIDRLVDRWDRLLSVLVPRRWWAYVIISAKP